MKLRAAAYQILSLFLLIILCVSSCSESDLSPEPVKITPAVGWNYENTIIIVQGNNFFASITENLSTSSGPEINTSFIILLDDIPLNDIQFLGENRFTALVPAGLPAKKYSLTVVNPDGSSGTLQNAFEIIDTPVLNIESIMADSTIVSTGQTGISVAMLINNPMQVDISVATAVLTFDLGTYTSSLTSPAALPATIAGEASQLFTFNVDVSPISVTGLCPIDGFVSGEHIDSSTSVSDNSAASPASWTIQMAGQLNIDSISTAATTVTQGQSEIPVTMTVSNLGEVDVQIDTVQLTFSQGTYTSSTGLPALPLTLAADGTQAISFLVNVASDAATGLCVIDANVTGTDANSGQSTSDTSAATTDSWTVQTPALVTINSISSSYTQVFQGQTGIAVTMAAENLGQAGAVIETASLTFSHGTYSTTLTSPSLPVTITNGSPQIFSFFITVDSASTLGEATINGNISGIDQNSGANISDESATTTDSWTIVGSLDHFSFDPISSPQTVDQPFSVTITAKDNAETTITGYTGPAGLLDGTGTILPSTTGLFISGVWTDDVIIGQDYIDLYITADDSGITGESNTFTVASYVPDPPETTIDSMPDDPSCSNTATFAFSCDETDCTYECNLDGAGWLTCTSPKMYIGLSDGSHSFTVRATDNDDETDPTPDSYSWDLSADYYNVEQSSSRWRDPSGHPYIIQGGTDTDSDNICATENISSNWFEFFGQPYQTIYISSNGFLTFQDAAVCTDNSPDTIADATDPDNLIAPLWADLEPEWYWDQNNGCTDTGGLGCGLFPCLDDRRHWDGAGDIHAYETTCEGQACYIITWNDVAEQGCEIDAICSVDTDNDQPPSCNDGQCLTMCILNPDDLCGDDPDERPAETCSQTFDLQVVLYADGCFDINYDTFGLLPGSYTAGIESGDDFTDGQQGYSISPGSDTFRFCPCPVGLALPETTIILQPDNETSSSFEFHCLAGDCSFECRLDDSAWSSCSSPKNYPNLSEGRHTLEVRAIGDLIDGEQTPATYTWEVDRR